MNDEVKAAAERLRTYYATEIRCSPILILADCETVAKAYLEEYPDTLIWTDEQCFALNANQHDHNRHPYTCGNDSRHRPLIATRHGWRCADCDYRQDWAHTTTALPAKGVS